MFWALLVLAALLGSAWLVYRRPSTWAAAVLASLSLIWLVVNRPIEGPVLVTVAINHGITLADLLTPTDPLAGCPGPDQAPPGPPMTIGRLRSAAAADRGQLGGMLARNDHGSLAGAAR